MKSESQETCHMTKSKALHECVMSEYACIEFFKPMQCYQNVCSVYKIDSSKTFRTAYLT